MFQNKSFLIILLLGLNAFLIYKVWSSNASINNLYDTMIEVDKNQNITLELDSIQFKNNGKKLSEANLLSISNGTLMSLDSLIASSKAPILLRVTDKDCIECNSVFFDEWNKFVSNNKYYINLYFD